MMTTAVAVREITVNVTQDHIDKGRPCDGQACPIALAILDAVPGAAFAEVYWAAALDAAAATIWLERGTLSGRLGKTADRFVRAFDWREPVGPFTFTMTIPGEAA